MGIAGELVPAVLLCSEVSSQTFIIFSKRTMNKILEHTNPTWDILYFSFLFNIFDPYLISSCFLSKQQQFTCYFCSIAMVHILSLTSVQQ